MTKGGKLPIGLWKELWNFSQNGGVPVSFDVAPTLNKGIKRDNYTKFVNLMNEYITSTDNFQNIIINNIMALQL